MPDVIFCRTRHEYQSYTDYWRLVELSGYPVIYVDELDPQSDNTYIVTPLNGEWDTGWQNPRARIILYDLEWHLDGINTPGLYDVWAADMWYAACIGAKYVPLGSHPDLKLRPTYEKRVQYDVTTLWYVTGRRVNAIDQFSRRGVTVSPSDVWGAERHAVLSWSRSMVHVHQRDDAFTVAPQRFALAAAYSLPMITETLADCGIFTHTYRLMSDLKHMGEFVSMWTHKDCQQRLNDYGLALHRLLCQDYTFRKVVEANV